LEVQKAKDAKLKLLRAKRHDRYFNKKKLFPHMKEIGQLIKKSETKTNVVEQWVNLRLFLTRMRNQHFKTVLVRRKKTFYPTACERWCGTTLFNNIVEALKRTRHERNWKVIARRTTWSNSDQKTMSR